MSYPLFSVYGIELEYMIVEADTLQVKPIADQLLMQEAGAITNEVEAGEISWSNELVLHVVELKTTSPSKTLVGLSDHFHQNIQKINRHLSNLNAKLMPTGAHPWMDPHQETCLWPHGDNSIYSSYDRIFGCQGHGFANLQSAHLNLPFANDEEFMQLNNAIRLLLPIMPALTASSPYLDAAYSGYLDARLSFYGINQQIIPLISGAIIPEFIKSAEEYQRTILEPMYAAIKAHDPEGILQYEWLNSRGAIARFDRNAIEIRILDTQECPLADLACIAAITGVLQWLIATQDAYLTHPLDLPLLRQIFDVVIHEGLNTPIDSKQYWQQFGMLKRPQTLRFAWHDLVDRAQEYIPREYHSVIECIIRQGNLAERLLSAMGQHANRAQLATVYGDLCSCLHENQLFGL